MSQVQFRPLPAQNPVHQRPAFRPTPPAFNMDRNPPNQSIVTPLSSLKRELKNEVVYKEPSSTAAPQFASRPHVQTLPHTANTNVYPQLLRRNYVSSGVDLTPPPYKVQQQGTLSPSPPRATNPSTSTKRSNNPMQSSASLSANPQRPLISSSKVEPENLPNTKQTRTRAESVPQNQSDATTSFLSAPPASTDMEFAEGSRLGETSVPLVAPDSFDEVKAVVRDYERLLEAEKERRHHLNVERNQTIKNLRGQVEHLEKALRGTADELDIASLIENKEAELRILFEAKDHEISTLEQQLIVQRSLYKDLKGVLLKATPLPYSVTELEAQKLKRYLAHREDQLRQAEIIADTRQQQYQALLGELAMKEALIARYRALHPEDEQLRSVANKTAHQLNYLESEVTTMRQLIDELSFEKQELQHVLIQRDKQLSLMQGVDPGMTDASAIQLGVQAITMVQGTAELKELIRSLQSHVAGLEEDLKDLSTSNEETQQKLAEKRREAAKLIETLATRDMRIARLDTLLQHRDKELMSTKEESRQNLGKERQKVARMMTELSISGDQLRRLRDELASRDDRFLTCQGDIVRLEKLNTDLESHVKMLNSELTEAQKHLHRLIRQNIAKDQYMLELEKRMKDNEVKRQATYLTEVAKSRKLQLDLHLKENDCRVALNDKEDQIRLLKSDLVSSTKQVDAVKNLIMYASSTGALTAPHLSADAIDTSQRLGMMRRGSGTSDTPSNGEALSSSGGREVVTRLTKPHPTKMRTRGGLGPFIHSSNNLSGRPAGDGEEHLKSRSKAIPQSRERLSKAEAGRSTKHLRPHSIAALCRENPIFNYSSATGLVSVKSPVNVKRNSIDSLAGEDLAHQTTPQGETSLREYLETYTAEAGDEVDKALKEMFAKGDYRPYRSLICRLSAGTYLYGTERVRFRVNSSTGQVEGQPDLQVEVWLPFAQFLQAMVAKGVPEPPLQILAPNSDKLHRDKAYPLNVPMKYESVH